MLIDFNAYQLEKFDRLAQEIQRQPAQFIDFEFVSDFYKVDWLLLFPTGTHWTVTGLDDGAEEFYILIEYKNHFLKIYKTSHIQVYFGINATE